MGLSFSCPFAVYDVLEDGFEYAIKTSLNFWDKEVKACKSKGTEPIVSVKAHGNKESDVLITSTSTEFSEMDLPSEKITPISDLKLMIPRHEAATKLQKVYKSFRTRRKLADCAVLIEQSWWKLLDFVELKRSSISFYDIEKHETAISRWSRARTRAAKVGKGLSQNSKAQKLALQHWLEAIDPRHRYGHNLHPYYNKWLHSQSLEPFFYWLDIGEGKEVNLVEEASRSKLQHQCIKYLGPMERLAYEVVVENGKLVYKKSGELVDTFGEPETVKWIFVLSTSMTLYVGQKRKGTFQHSSFLAGGATSSAGRLVVVQGILKAIWPHSGHYRPTAENFQDFVSFLSQNNVDLSDVKMYPVDEEDSLSKEGSIHQRSISSKEDLIETQNFELDQISADPSNSSITNSRSEPSQPKPLLKKLSKFSIRSNSNLLENSDTEDQSFETATELFDGDEDDVEIISEESIMKRINSHKEMKSFQLGRQLSCKWTTGAGPRIGCVRDYPSKLQSHALEQLDLSPRSGGHFSSNSSRESTPRSFDPEFPRIRRCAPHLSPLCKEILAIEVTE